MKDVFITSSVLIGAMLVLRILFRRAISRRVQYALWALVLLRLLIPVSLPAIRHNVLTAAEPVSSSVTAAARQNVYYSPYASYPLDAFADLDSPAPYDPHPGDVLIEGEDSYGVVEGEKVVLYRRRVQPLQILRYIWYGGMAVMAAWFLAANLRFSRRLRRTRVPLEGTESRYPVYLCDDIPSPCLFGLFRPCIYVTSEGARDEARLRCIIAHEETHARHLDPLWSLLRSLCLAVWWFHPLVWAAAHFSRIDCELACDEGALARLEEDERLTYGETLLALIPRRRAGAPLLAATTMGSGKGELRDRIRRIAERKKPLVIALPAAAVILAAVCLLTFTGKHARQEDPKPAVTAEPAAATVRPAVTAGPANPVQTAAPVSGPAADGSRDGLSPLPAEGTPLTGEEMTWFNDVFFADAVYAGTDTRINLRNQFLQSLYASPEDVDLFELFYCGTGEAPQPLSDEEFRLAGTDECATDKLPAAEMDTVFLANTGLHIAETKGIGLDKFRYLEDYDAYYHIHGDTNYMMVRMVQGMREGDLVRLFYQAGEWRCVTLRRTEDGDYRFVSNLPSGKPAIPPVYPAEEPWAVIPLDQAPSCTPETVRTETRERDVDSRLDSWLLEDGTLLQFYRSKDGNRYFALVRDWRDVDWTEYRTETFLSIPAMAPAVRYYDGLFGRRCVMILYGDYISGSLQTGGQWGLIVKVYAFDETGAPVLLADTAASCEDHVKVLDLDGDGTDELITEAGPRSALYFMRGGEIRTADLYPLLKDAAGEENLYWDGGVIEENYRCLVVRCYAGQRTLIRYLYFDGSRLTVYAQPHTLQSGHLAAGIGAPPEVTADALAAGERMVQELIYGEYGWQFGPWVDDWCVSRLDCTVTEREDYAIETYSLSLLLHASDPEKVVLAGGMQLSEDNWVSAVPADPCFLFYKVTPEGERQRLEGGAAANAWEDGPGNNAGFSAILAYLELLNGLRTPGELSGAELRRLFIYFPFQTMDYLGAVGEKVYTAAFAAMLQDAEADVSIDLEDLRYTYSNHAIWFDAERGVLTPEGAEAAAYLGRLLDVPATPGDLEARKGT